MARSLKVAANATCLHSSPMPPIAAAAAPLSVQTILFFVLMACLLIYYTDRLQEEADIIAFYSTITNINILETDTWFWLLVAGLVIVPLPLM